MCPRCHLDMTGLIKSRTRRPRRRDPVELLLSKNSRMFCGVRRATGGGASFVRAFPRFLIPDTMDMVTALNRVYMSRSSSGCRFLQHRIPIVVSSQIRMCCICGQQVRDQRALHLRALPSRLRDMYFATNLVDISSHVASRSRISRHSDRIAHRVDLLSRQCLSICLRRLRFLNILFVHVPSWVSRWETSRHRRLLRAEVTC